MIANYETQSATATAVNTKVVRVYACGGFGINRGRDIQESYVTMSERDKAHYVKPDVVYVDSSRGNLIGLEASAQTYILKQKPDLLKNATGEELTGGGGDRAYLRELAEEAAPEIVAKFPFFTYNVVIFSAHGASGCTLGMQIYREALKQKKHVVLIVVGGAHGAHRVQNTNAVLRALMKYQQDNNWSAGVYYQENPGLLPTDELGVNQKVLEFWAGLSNVLAGNASRLDQRDIMNWLQLPDSLQLAKSLYLLGACFSDSELEGAKNVVSVIGAVAPNTELSDGARATLNSAVYLKLGVVEDSDPQLNAVFLTASALTDEFLRGVVSSGSNARDELTRAARPVAQVHELARKLFDDNDVF